MPDEPRNTHGRTLREQMRAAAAATAEQQRARKQGEGGSGKGSKKGTSKRTVTKRTASKDQQQKEKARDKSAKETEKRSFVETVRDNFLNMGLGLRVLFGAIALLIVAAAVLYPMGCTYYQALRQEQTLQAELDAVNQRNEQIEAENKQLETDEGVENQAREEYGWVKDDEKATVVVNSSDSGSGDMPSQVDGSKIEPPHTWYYDILDIIFRAEV
ncbi:MAG: septum formation initiator family protein [Coriobacteriales bacterium]